MHTVIGLERDLCGCLCSCSTEIRYRRLGRGESRLIDQDDKVLFELLENLPSETRVLEIGAFVGKFSKIILNKFQDCLIIEGNQHLHRSLIQNFPQHQSKILNKIVYHDEQEHKWYERSENQGASALVFPIHLPHIKDFTTVKTQTISLDSLGFDFDFVKIDAEGADFRILQGAINLIHKNKPLIFFEHSGQIGANIHGYDKTTFFQFFQDIGYSLHFANGVEFVPSMWLIDTTKTLGTLNIIARYKEDQTS